MANKTSKSTRYVILRKSDANPPLFSILGEVAATSAASALRHLVTEVGNYVAVPSRSFTPVNVSVRIPEPVLVISNDSQKPSPETSVATAAQVMRDELEPRELSRA